MTFPPSPANPRHAPRGTRASAGGAGRVVFVPEPVRVRELASLLGLKPFKVVADLLELKHFKGPDDDLDFQVAALVVEKHGGRAERPPPGMLVL